MPAARRRTTENRHTGTMGTTRRAYQTGRYGGLVEDLGHARRAQVYGNPDAVYAAEPRRDDPRHEISDLERAWIANRVHTLYVQQGRSLLDIESDTQRSNSFIRLIIFEHKFVKGKKVKK